MCSINGVVWCCEHGISRHPFRGGRHRTRTAALVVGDAHPLDPAHGSICAPDGSPVRRGCSMPFSTGWRGAASSARCTTESSTCRAWSPTSPRTTGFPNRCWCACATIERALPRRLPGGFATAGLCCYRDGSDSVAWHGDRFGRGATPTPSSRSSPLGSPGPAPAPARRWHFATVPLGSGDLLVMGGSCQRTWDHAVPKGRPARRESVFNSGRQACGEPPCG